MSYPQQNYFYPDLKWWEVSQERFRQVDALARIGEFAMFVLMWSVLDYNAGLVSLCTTCNSNVGIDTTIQSVYKQPTFARCPTCSGSLYQGPHGGIKAQIVRPSIWQFDEVQTDWQRRGEVERQMATVTTASDFRAQPRDYILRGDGNRYQISSVEVLHLTTGFGAVSHSDTALSVNYRVALESPTSVIYDMALTGAQLQSVLNPSYPRQGPNFSSYEFIDGPTTF